MKDPKLDFYDSILVDLCDLVIRRQKQDADLFGMVGAAVIVGNTVVLNTSHRYGSQWVHAEKNAINSYELRHGPINNSAVIITTLSPCCDPMSDRYGNSCTDFISERGITTVYYGYSDPTQSDISPQFDLIETQNSQIRDLCRLFARTFLSI